MTHSTIVTEELFNDIISRRQRFLIVANSAIEAEKIQVGDLIKIACEKQPAGLYTITTIQPVPESARSVLGLGTEG